MAGSWQKEENGGGSKRKLHAHDPRGEASAFGHLRVVDKAADHDVDEGVNETGSHKQCSHQRRGKTENIGVENHEERIHQVEGEIVAHIAKRVANHVANIEIASIHRLSLLAFRCDGRH